MDSIATTTRDPLEVLLLRKRRVWRLGTLVALSALTWAAWPMMPWSGLSANEDERGALSKNGTGYFNSSVPGGESSVDGQRVFGDEAEFDAQAFNVALWTPPPMKEVIVAAPPPPPPPPLKVQLLGITGDGSVASPLRACLYDPDTDRVMIVGQGDPLAPFTVRSLTSDAIEFVDGSRVERLSLRDPATSGAVPSGSASQGGGTR